MAAFLFGWTRLLVIRPALLGGIALIFAAYAAAFVPLGDRGVRVAAATAIAVLALANSRSTRWGAAVQNVSTVSKVVALAGLAVAVFLVGDGRAGAFAEPIILRPPSALRLREFPLPGDVGWRCTGWVDRGAHDERVG